MPAEAFGVARLRARLESERKRLLNVLMLDLKNLHQRTAIAMAALKEGKPLDVHLIVNSASVTESLARWNMTHDLIPYLDAED